MFSDVRSGDLAWLGEKWVGFGPSLDGSGLDAARALTHPLLSDEDKQGIERVVVVCDIAVLSPGDPYLHGMLEAQLARQPVGQ